MEATTPLGALQAIAAISAKLARAGISKDRKNQQQNYTFRGIEDVYRALSPLLAEHYLCILPQVLQRVETERETKSGGSLYSVKVEVKFSLVSAKDGSWTSTTVWGEAMDSADKATNKAMSAAYKYMAFMTFCIPVEGTDDADDDTPEPTKSRARPVAKPAKADVFDTVEIAEAAIDGAKSLDALRAVWERVLASGFQGDDLARATEAKDERKAIMQGGA